MSNLNDRTIQDYKNAVSLLTEFIEQRVEKLHYKIADKTTNNFETFKKETLDNGYMTVTREGCDDTIYGDRLTNIKARVWHDIIHLYHNLDFSTESERQVCEYQKDELTEWFKQNKQDMNITVLYDAISLLHHDIVGQCEYYERYNCFVNHQESFVKNLFFNKS